MIDTDIDLQENIEAGFKETIGLSVINMHFDEEECSMILFRNWTDNFKHQFAKSELET